MKELYFIIEGPKGKAEIYEVIPDEAASPTSTLTFEPTYEVQYQGKADSYSSEGEAITVAQQLVGAQSSY